MPSSKPTTTHDWEWDVDWGQELEAAVSRLDEQMWHAINEEGEEGEEEWEPPSGYPFCGCDTCRTRELLCVVVPIVLDGFHDGRIRRYIKEDA